MKRHSEACERNAGPILEVLREAFADRTRVLEIGSGTGQHAVAFARALPHLIWQPADLAETHASIRAWSVEAGLANLLAPIALDLAAPPALEGHFDAVFSANVVHIVAWPLVERLFALAGECLPAGGVLVLYGPFNYGGRFTATSNAQFDLWLKSRDPASGIRDIEAVTRLACGVGLRLERDVAMPANNRTLVFRRPL